MERGEIVTETDIEALQQLGLAEPETEWEDYASAGALVAISVVLATLNTETFLKMNFQEIFHLTMCRHLC